MILVSVDPEEHACCLSCSRCKVPRTGRLVTDTIYAVRIVPDGGSHSTVLTLCALCLNMITVKGLARQHGLEVTLEVR